MTRRDQGDRLPSLAGAEWLLRTSTRTVLETLERGGHGARVVGGAVRNALLHLPVKDVDVATTAAPEEVLALAGAAGLRAIPTGIDHGTVTVVADHVPIEVTTLRHDVETDGRHAKVAFTTDWTEDAGRRDFTINALYCSGDGTIHDPLGGYADLKQRRVRFIGDPRERIREDYLRILRFFRFTAEYAPAGPDPAGLAATVELKDGLDRLSRERVRGEFLRLLAARRAVETIAAMQDGGILAHVVGPEADIRALMRCTAIEQTLGRTPDPLLRLGALTQERPGAALLLREHLKLSSHEFERLARMGLSDRAVAPQSAEREAKAFLYRHGPEAFADVAILMWARGNEPVNDPDWQTRIGLASRWQVPLLPVRGTDIVALGVPEGPAVGRVLRAFEDWWIEADFPHDPALLASALQKAATVAAH